MRLATANGTIEVSRAARCSLTALGVEVRALVAEDTPNVLSLSRLIAEHGFSFYWWPGSPPTLVHASGRQVGLSVLCGVPHYSE